MKPSPNSVGVFDDDGDLLPDGVADSETVMLRVVDMLRDTVKDVLRVVVKLKLRDELTLLLSVCEADVLGVVDQLAVRDELRLPLGEADTLTDWAKERTHSSTNARENKNVVFISTNRARCRRRRNSNPTRCSVVCARYPAWFSRWRRQFSVTRRRRAFPQAFSIPGYRDIC